MNLKITIFIMAFTAMLLSQEAAPAKETDWKVMEESNYRINSLLLLQAINRQLAEVAEELKQIRCASDPYPRDDCFKEENYHDIR